MIKTKEQILKRIVKHEKRRLEILKAMDRANQRGDKELLKLHEHWLRNVIDCSKELKWVLG